MKPYIYINMQLIIDINDFCEMDLFIVYMIMYTWSVA